MSDAYLDHLPSREREKIRRRLRSPEEYERLREKVRGPEDLEREMERNAEFAEARLSLESDRTSQEKAKNMVVEAMDDGDIVDAPSMLSPDVRAQVREGNFRVVVIEEQHEPTLSITFEHAQEDTIASEGTVRETFPLSKALQQSILSTFARKNPSRTSPLK